MSTESEKVARIGEGPRESLVREFYDAFNVQDLDRFVATLHPDVELQTARGVREGREEARAWATKDPGGGLEQTMMLTEVLADSRGAHAVALYTKRWCWREDGSVARDDDMAALFTVRDGLIARWQPFESPDEARALFSRLDAG